MGSIVITGADGPLIERVVRLVLDDASASPVVVLAPHIPPHLPAEVESRRVDLFADGIDDLKAHLEGAEALLHLAVSVPPSPTAATGDVDAARRVFIAAGDAGVRHIVLLSSATVYGAWPNNPVPLTEEAPLRPNPGFTFAAERAEIERLAAEWRDDHPSATLTVLRPVRTAAAGWADWLTRALRPAPAAPGDADEPPLQLLHVDDLARAIDTARRQRLDGAFNVAPVGAIAGHEVRSLMGAPPKVPLPGRLAGRFMRWGFRWGISTTPPELVPYTLHPWIVASDRLRARGWEPQVTNEEVAVEAHTAGPWATMSPRRRQEVALGGAVAALAGLAAAGALLARRWLRQT